MTTGRTVSALIVAVAVVAAASASGCSGVQPSPAGIATLQLLIPTAASVRVDSTLQLTARAIGPDGNPVTTVTFTWSTPDTTLRINAQTGLVTGVIANTVGRVQVSADSVASDLATITVLP